MALKKTELNILGLKVGDEIWIKVGSECKVRKRTKATVVALYTRYFLARLDYKGGSFYMGINYISCYNDLLSL